MDLTHPEDREWELSFPCKICDDSGSDPWASKPTWARIAGFDGMEWSQECSNKVGDKWD
jgi:hypothetical protein